MSPQTTFLEYRRIGADTNLGQRYVWTAWKAGIVENLNIPQVKEIFLKETKTERQRKSFYGLCEEIDIK